MNHDNINDIRAAAAALADQMNTKRRRQSDLTEKLAVMRATIATAVGAEDVAKEALAVALAVDDLEAASEARKQVVEARERAAQAADLSAECEALTLALAGIERDMTSLAEQERALADEERELLLPRLDAEAAGLEPRARALADELARLYARGAALSELAMSVGAGGGRYGPQVLQPVQFIALGQGRMDRPQFQVNPGSMVAAEKSAAVEKLRAEGFKAV